MRLADAGRAEEDDVLPALHEAEFVERVDLFALDRRLEGEVEVRQGLHARQPAGAHGRLEAATVAQRDLGGQEPLDGLGRGRAAALDPGEHAVQRLERAGHLQVGELGRDPLPARRPPHRTPPATRAYSASGRRSTSTSGGDAAVSACRRPGSVGRGTTGR